MNLNVNPFFRIKIRVNEIIAVKLRNFVIFAKNRLIY